MSSSYQIVVGVDGSEGGQRALRWAVREAGTRGATVHAVTAYTFDDLDGAAINQAQRQSIIEQMLAGQVADALEDNPAVTITTQATHGSAREILTAAANDADLLVLGSHGHGRLFHAVVGSVTESCIRMAACPVVVVPVPHTNRRPDIGDKTSNPAAPSGIPSGIL